MACSGAFWAGTGNAEPDLYRKHGTGAKGCRRLAAERRRRWPSTPEVSKGSGFACRSATSLEKKPHVSRTSSAEGPFREGYVTTTVGSSWSKSETHAEELWSALQRGFGCAA
eukprot:2183546-Rhodomonas_salina.1